MINLSFIIFFFLCVCLSFLLSIFFPPSYFLPYFLPILAAYTFRSIPLQPSFLPNLYTSPVNPIPRPSCPAIPFPPFSESLPLLSPFPKTSYLLISSPIHLFAPNSFPSIHAIPPSAQPLPLHPQHILPPNPFPPAHPLHNTCTFLLL